MIRTAPATDAYRDNWDRIFKKRRPRKLATQTPPVEVTEQAPEIRDDASPEERAR